MAWHAAGTYRTRDGAAAPGPASSFAPLNSWPDNVNLDKAQAAVADQANTARKFVGRPLVSPATSLESMGFKTFGFGGGRQTSGNRKGLLGLRGEVAG
jgi:catalase-peroxidase